MDKICISNLVTCPNISFSGTLSVQSLVNESKKTKTLGKDIDDIMRLQKERSIKKKQTYKKQLKICIDKMKEENMMHKDNMIFAVPQFLFDCPEYDPEECINYINIKLKKNHLDTKVNGLSMFVSWLYTPFYKKKHS